MPTLRQYACTRAVDSRTLGSVSFPHSVRVRYEGARSLDRNGCQRAPKSNWTRAPRMNTCLLNERSYGSSPMNPPATVLTS